MVVLLQFNHFTSRTLEQLQDNTQIRMVSNLSNVFHNLAFLLQMSSCNAPVMTLHNVTLQNFDLFLTPCSLKMWKHALVFSHPNVKSSIALPSIPFKPHSKCI